MIRRTLAAAALLGGALAATACSSEPTSALSADRAGVLADSTPKPPPPPPPPPTTSPQDSVYSGYGSGSTGGIEYQNFEYEPETGTEYVVTPDTTASKGELEPTEP